MVTTFHADRSGLRVYIDGSLVAVITPDGFPELMFQLAKANREIVHAVNSSPSRKPLLRTIASRLRCLAGKIRRAARVDRVGRSCRR